MTSSDQLVYGPWSNLLHRSTFLIYSNEMKLSIRSRRFVEVFFDQLKKTLINN